jgi:hypothetical protein
MSQAVEVLFHRSAEQAKLAGSGRLMAVALGKDKIHDYIKVLQT